MHCLGDRGDGNIARTVIRTVKHPGYDLVGREAVGNDRLVIRGRRQTAKAAVELRIEPRDIGPDRTRVELWVAEAGEPAAAVEIGRDR